MRAKNRLVGFLGIMVRNSGLLLSATLALSLSAEAMAPKKPGASGAARSQAAEDGAYLDARYPKLKHPVAAAKAPKIPGFEDLVQVPRRSDTGVVLQRQTAVKSQASRGTCSIFSAIALLEAQLVASAGFSTALDLSEEWLQYVIKRNQTSEGSTSTANFRALVRYGAPEESLYPYIGENWEGATTGIAAERCGKLQDPLLASCLLGHRDPRLMMATDVELRDPASAFYDPEFYQARRQARRVASQYLKGAPENYWLGTIDEAKALLRQGIPLTLDIDFYYGAWNHRLGPDLGIPRNLDHWDQGIIGYPAAGSVDRLKSLEDPAGHSVLVVGYDDDVEVTTRVLMQDGSEQTLTYRGVYYFKNSWGTSNFGRSFTFEGKAYPGYGMITQQYAHEFGAFFRFMLPGAQN